ncbi:hypothetical protein A2118_00405 [Candidatus Kaiserbacteria bacterium GWA2_50_9]|uniref:PEP-utilising enzyme mobile domain-containing protein n=1 Tax=Candidatus Kaiserbacteria bacterium GWA2_50_9 TaxID=1798474 RepID=A0A1F6BVM2_9BACT|nr:MAG: hypothetical protein A2118_00405 [Candidatus Kaiserbacteria bacterium GWA2_50_9]
MIKTHPFVERFIKEIGKDTPMSLEGNLSALIAFGSFNHEWSELIREQYGFSFGPLLSVVQGKHCVVAFSRDTYYNTMLEGFEKFKQQGENMRHVTKFEQSWRDSDALVKEFPLETIPKMGNEELRALLVRTFNITKASYSASVFSEMLDENAVKGMYTTAGGTEREFGEFFRISSSPTFESFALRIDQMLVESISLSETQSFFSDYFITPPLEEIGKKRETLIAERGGRAAIEKDIGHIHKELALNKTAADSYRPTLSVPLQTVFDYVQLCMYTRDVRRLPFNKLFTLGSNIARELCKREGITQNRAPYFFPWELTKGPISEDLKEEIEKRMQNGYLCYMSTDGATVGYDSIDEVRTQLFAFVDSYSAGKELVGSAAYRGQVKGTIQIIRSEKDFPTFKRGNILVTSMTRPEFVPLMKRASAIITDEGGVTCHAAIVSRELKLPCITGTKNATRVLHDGDVVEVDAEKGIVRILERK